MLLPEKGLTVQSRLVCKIEVETSDGKRRGTGYPITPDRIITAAHVIADAKRAKEGSAEGDARRITLSYGLPAQTLTTPVWLEWSGEPTVDVAVLRCQLPPDLQPTHRLVTDSLDKLTEWHAQGYTDFGRQKRPDHKDNYHGTLDALLKECPTVVLDVGNGLTQVQQWRGGSGSVAFEADMPQRPLAVITQHQDGKKLDQLVAVPIAYLLHAEGVRDGFRRAIRFATYEQRRSYRDEVIQSVTMQLQFLELPVLQQVVHAINASLPHGSVQLDIERGEKVLAKDAAVTLVSQAAVMDVVARLVGLMETLAPDAAHHVAEIIDALLPLNYAPGVVQGLQDQLTSYQLGLIDNMVSTRTLAEIIMAGYDQQPARFVPLADGHTDVRGRTAIDCSDAPEEGPGDVASERLGVLRAADTLLRDLLALKDTLLGMKARPLERTLAPAQHEAELERMIRGNAIRLGGALLGVSKSQNFRTVYGVLRLPPEGTPEREFRKRVIAVVREHIPSLIFVELMQTPTTMQEYEVETYVQMRVLRTQSPRIR